MSILTILVSTRPSALNKPHFFGHITLWIYESSLVDYTHLPFLSQSPQPPAHRAYALAGDHRVFLAFLCALCELCERLNGPS